MREVFVRRRRGRPQRVVSENYVRANGDAARGSRQTYRCVAELAPLALRDSWRSIRVQRCTLSQDDAPGAPKPSPALAPNPGIYAGHSWRSFSKQPKRCEPECEPPKPWKLAGNSRGGNKRFLSTEVRTRWCVLRLEVREFASYVVILCAVVRIYLRSYPFRNSRPVEPLILAEQGSQSIRPFRKVRRNCGVISAFSGRSAFGSGKVAVSFFVLQRQGQAAFLCRQTDI
jgi:hypothetical protein